MENELVVRLVECAKPLNSVYDGNDPTQVLVTGWADTTTVPKRGEICLEYYTNTDSSSENYGKICYRMKIGDGIHKYIESDPDDSLPYFPLSDDVINLIASWVNTHLNVNEYAQANYINSTNTLKIYSINEKYGKIGHLADSEDTPSLDIEVTFSEGAKIDLSSENNTLTIAHEDTTRADTDNPTDIAANTKVVTGVTTDATGHVTGITTYKFPAYTTIAPVQSVAGDNKWTSVSTSSNTATVSHIGPDTSSTSSATKTAGTDVDWEGAVVTGVTIDSTGHVTGVTTGNIPDNPVGSVVEHTETDSDKGIAVSVTTENGSVSGVDVAVTNTDLIAGGVIDDGIAVTNPWISKTTDNSTKVVTLAHTDPSTEDSNKSITEVAKDTHILTGISIDAKGHVRTKPDTKELTVETGGKISFGVVDASTIQLVHVEADRSDDPQSGNMSFGTAVVTGVTTDDYGHVTCVTTKAIPENPVSGLEGTASDTASGITVQVDSTGGEVDNVDVTVALDTLKSALGLTGALIPKGTIGTGGTITTLPTASASNLGWAYKVITAGTYSGISAKVGDVIYCILNDDGETYSWTLIPSGDESFTDTWRNIKVNGVEKLGTGISSGALNVVDGSHSSVNWDGTNKTLQIDVDEASTSQKGVVELTDSYTSTDDTKAATGKSIKAAIDELDVATDKGAASISGTTLTIKAVQQKDGKIKDGGTTTINLESSYDASTNKIATQKTVADAIESLDVEASDTTLDITGTGLDVITEVSEVNGKIASKKKTLAEGNKIDISAASGSITIAHESITTTPTDNSVDPPDGLGNGERESYVITDVTTDGYGHITAYTKDKSTNLIAADIKAPVKRQDDSTWNYRETGGDITIGEDTAKIPVLKGNTLVWNQLVGANAQSVTLLSGHKYYIKVSSTEAIIEGNGNAISVTGGTDMVIDLTKMFGSDANICVALGVANLTDVVNLATAAVNFEKLFPNPYYPYCEGRLVNLGGYGVKMNQLVQNGNFADGTTGWSINGMSSTSVSNNELHITTQKIIDRNYYVYQNLSPINNHLYYSSFKYKGSVAGTYRYGAGTYDEFIISSVNTWEYKSKIITSSNLSRFYLLYAPGSDQLECSFDFKDVQIIDLTLMFGAGNEPSLEECEQIFTQDYYEYNTGYDCNILDVANKKLELLSTDSTPSTGAFPDESEPHAVDMGLPNGLLWADSNIDVTQEDGFAASPYQYGATFFSWGNVKGQNPNSSNAFDESWGSASDGEPYVSTQGAGLTMNIPYSLDFDAAYRNTDAPWRMPTSAEFQELKDNCDFIDASDNVITGDNKLTTVNGIVGIYMRSKINGNRLFFAASGYGNGSSWDYYVSGGCYWSASFYSSSNARYLFFYSGGVYTQGYDSRSYGFVVRPVRSKKQTLDLDWIREIEYTPDGSSTPEKLFPYGLLSAGSAHDEVTETKAIKRVGVVDLGTLQYAEWSAATGMFWFYLNDKKSGIANLLSAKFNTYDTYDLIPNDDVHAIANVGSVSGYEKKVIIKDSSLVNQSAGDVHLLLNGIKLYYELDTPVEIPLDQPHPMQYAVADHGTEQQLPVSAYSPYTAPFAGEFQYMSNFKEGVLDLMGRFNDFTPTTEIIPDSNSTLPTSQAVIDYMRAGGNGVKPVYESGDEVTPTTDVHAGLKTEVGNNSYKYYKVPFSAVTNDPSTGTSQVQIILNGNFS